MKAKILIFWSLFLLSFSVFAGNEPLQKNNGQIDLNYQFTKFNSVFDEDGELRPIPEIRFNVANINAKYSLTDRITANVFAPVYSSAVNSENNDLKITEAKSNSGFGDVLVGVNYAFTKQNKIQPVISIYQSLGTGSNEASGLNTGFGDFANSIYFDLFYELNSNWMVNGNIGYQNRKKNFKNDFLGNVFINYNKKDKYSFSVFMKGKLPFGEVSNEDNIVNYGLFKNSEGFIRYGAMASIYFRKNMSLIVNYENYLKGQFIAYGPVFSGGIRIDFTNMVSTEQESKN